jgi:hypothetical protein
MPVASIARMTAFVPLGDDPTTETVLPPFESGEIELALEPLDFLDDLPAPLPPLIPPPPPGRDLLDSLGTVEDLWDACAETVRLDFGEAHIDGPARLVDEYLDLEHTGTFGALGAREQQRLIQDLATEYVRR